ncbi:hypothetical protein E2C01_006756 [Portunus trituberculatus]|uniref:Uncharacterized protein n=1 Tax=Portunus trituberculatus TaxID=210409 RepID=A0A5B7D2P1_PORTR|nr:hypothetical protein [Portunus trituberculatus]
MTLETISLWRWRYAVLSLTLLPLVSSILTPALPKNTPDPSLSSVCPLRPPLMCNAGTRSIFRFRFVFLW